MHDSQMHVFPFDILPHLRNYILWIFVIRNCFTKLFISMKNSVFILSSIHFINNLNDATHTSWYNFKRPKPMSQAQFNGNSIYGNQTQIHINMTRCTIKRNLLNIYCREHGNLVLILDRFILNICVDRNKQIFLYIWFEWLCMYAISIFAFQE